MSVPNGICTLSVLRACEGISAMCSNTLATASIVVPAGASDFFADVTTSLAKIVRFLNDSANEIRNVIENENTSAIPFCIRFDDNGEIMEVTDEAEKKRMLEKTLNELKEQGDILEDDTEDASED